MGFESPLPLPLPSPAPAATSLAPGFRFHPTDQELVSYYLKRKVCGKPIRFDAISETDIYKSEPWDLPALSRLKSKDNEWYFFGVQDKKYVNGSRVNRATGKGYWKATGNDRPISLGNKTIGMKKTLVFYSGRAPCGKRTNWVMHEYRLTDEDVAKEGVSLDAYLLCKILKKSGPGFKPGEQYGPFVEEEWDHQEEATLVPGEDAEDDAAGNGDCCDQATPPVHSANPSEPPPPPASGNSAAAPPGPPVTLTCKIEITDDEPEPFPVISNKRLRCEPNPNPNSVDISTSNRVRRTSSISIDTNFSTALMELPLLEILNRKEAANQDPNSATPIDIIDINVPPNYLKFFEELRKEIYKISLEKESLKIEVMSARTMINILNSKIDHLTKENEDLKRIVQKNREG